MCYMTRSVNPHFCHVLALLSCYKDHQGTLLSYVCSVPITMQATNEPPTPAPSSNPPQTPKREAIIRSDVKDTPIQGFKNSTANERAGVAELDPTESRGNQAHEMIVQLAKVSVEDFMSALRSEASELGTILTDVPDDRELRLAYPGLDTALSEANFKGHEVDLYPLLVSSVPCSPSPAKPSSCSARSYKRRLIMLLRFSTAMTMPWLFATPGTPGGSHPNRSNLTYPSSRTGS